MPALLLRIAVVALLVVGVALVGAWLRRRDGRVREASGDLDLADRQRLGLGEVARHETAAVLLGSPTCAPCVSVKRLLAEVAAERDDFHWAYADAADHLALTERLRILRVPTLLVLDADGRILTRTSGVPAKHDLVRALDRDGDLVA